MKARDFVCAVNSVLCRKDSDRNRTNVLQSITENKNVECAMNLRHPPRGMFLFSIQEVFPLVACSYFPCITFEFTHPPPHSYFW